MAQLAQRPELRLYVEGGGDSADGRARLREGFGIFLREIRQACEAAKIRWTITCTGSNSETFKALQNAVIHYRGSWSGMLIDSDCTHLDGAGDVLALLRKKGWDIGNLTKSQCHLMVVHMETWLAADPDALEQHFGKNFERKALPSASNLEGLAGRRVMEALDKAVRKTKSGEYKKIHDGAKLLQLINPRCVRQRAPSCQRLFETLLGVVRDLKAGSQ